MIRYMLACDSGHEFEGWFGSSDDFDRQGAHGLLACPVCDSRQVSKTLMAPSVSTSRKREAALTVASSRDDEAAPVPAVPGAGMQLAGLTQEQRAIVRKMRELKDRLLSQAEDVGERFSEEARKIHYGEAEARGIYGRASLEEARELIEEGVEFTPLPDLPEEQN
ncbi:MAG: DUF1178 family protein [Pseudomonadota bacterium]|nr:DUF1178 family protein [Pseudomonadota bacterium]